MKKTIKKIFGSLGIEVSRKKPDISVTKNDSGLNCRAIHVGCGPIIADGYLNIDSELSHVRSGLQTGQAYSINGKPNTFILPYDLRRGLPLANNQALIIYHSHFLEHLTDEEGVAFVRDCYRCLASDGVMRFAVPDFKLWTTSYINEDKNFFEWYRRVYLNNDFDRYPTNSSVLNGMIYNWGHKIAYDFETLLHVLSKAGFVGITAAKWGISEKVKNIQSLEGDSSQRRFESLVIECSKPKI